MNLLVHLGKNYQSQSHLRVHSMSNHEFPKINLEEGLQSIRNITWAIAQEHQDDSLSLLAILRLLEQVHQEIRDDLFQQSLPDNRQSLYKLLRDIETKGGWPYIYRMKLQSIMEKMELKDLEEETAKINLDSQKPSSSSYVEPFS